MSEATPGALPSRDPDFLWRLVLQKDEVNDALRRQIVDLQTQLNQYETPAWQANDALNRRIEICYQALERIIANFGERHVGGIIARRALEAAADVK